MKQRLHPALSLFINSVAAYKAVALNVRGEVVPSTSLSLRDALRWGQDRPCKTLSLIVHPHAIISVVPIIDSALNHTRTSGFPPARGEGVSPLCAEAGTASNKGRMPAPRKESDFLGIYRAFLLFYNAVLADEMWWWSVCRYCAEGS